MDMLVHLLFPLEFLGGDKGTREEGCEEIGRGKGGKKEREKEGREREGHGCASSLRFCQWPQGRKVTLLH